MTRATIERRMGLLLPSLFFALVASSAPWSAMVISVGALQMMTSSSSHRRRGSSSSTALRLGDDVVVTGSQSQPNMKKKDLRTLQRFLEVECWKLPQIRSLDRTLLAVSDACKQINRIVQRAQTDDLYGAAIDPTTGLEAELNVQGEAQQQLDVLCNTLMLRAFCGASNDAVCAVASEEEPLPRSCADVMGYDVSTNSLVGGDLVKAFNSGEYVAVFDPIDGSKNIDSSLPVGTVFGIYRRPEGSYSPGSAREKSIDSYDLDGFLQRGTKMVAAGYCLYSATTVLVLTLGSGVHGFTLDPDRQIFLQTHPNMRIPDVGSLYSFNEANSRDYSEPVQKFLKNMKETGKMG
jgi:fructose-1,6-bisphosphatase I